MHFTEWLASGDGITKEKVDKILEAFGLKKETKLFEMTRIDVNYNAKSMFGTNGKYSVCVYGNEGDKLPHFHIIDNQTKGKKFDMKIRINDLSIMSVLDKEKRVKKSESGITWEGYTDLRRNLISFLNSNYIDKYTGNVCPRYLLIAQIWDLNNSDHPLHKGNLMTKIE